MTSSSITVTNPSDYIYYLTDTVTYDYSTNFTTTVSGCTAYYGIAY